MYICTTVWLNKNLKTPSSSGHYQTAYKESGAVVMDMDRYESHSTRPVRQLNNKLSTREPTMTQVLSPTLKRQRKSLRSTNGQSDRWWVW